MTAQDRDTIVALSTPPGTGLRAIVRLSGPRSLAIAKTMTGQTAGSVGPAYSAAGVRIRPPSWASSFPGVLYIMRAPRSYTKEDVAELHLPGSPAICSAVLEACLDLGARPARPGEFTYRAFMNGRIDLSQAEGVNKLIKASDAAAARAAVMDLGGRLGAEERAMTSSLTMALSLVETRLDFTDQDFDPVDAGEIVWMVGSAAGRARTALAGDGGSSPSSEPLFLLAGRANAGKSTLLNALAGRKLSVVSSEPGTTRDPVAAALVVGGARVRVADPAGIGGEAGTVGVKATSAFEKWLGAADAVIALFDGSIKPGPEEETLDSLCSGRNCLRVLNKCDLPARDLSEMESARGPFDFKVSALTGAGVPELALAVAALACSPGTARSPEGFGLSARQRSALKAAAGACDRALEAMENGADEICALEIREAIESLGRISGRELTEEVLGGIFSDFCVGK